MQSEDEVVDKCGYGLDPDEFGYVDFKLWGADGVKGCTQIVLN